MKNTLNIEGKNYISARQAAANTGYAQDYIGQLCRGGKIEGKMIGRSWFVSEQSLLNYGDLSITSAKENIENITEENVSKNSIVSAYKYEPIISPLLPELDKTMRASEGSIIVKTDERRATAVLIITLVLVASSFIFNLSSSEIIHVSDNVIERISSGLEKGSDRLATYFFGYFNDSNFQATAVNSLATDNTDRKKNDIANHFSDEITVHENANNHDGVITPIFKESKGEEFMYVVVPMNDNKK